MWRRWLCGSHDRGWCGSFAARNITACCRCYYDLHRRNIHCRHCHFGLGFDRDRSLLFGRNFCRLNRLLGCCRRRHCRRLDGNGDGGRWARHRLRCDEARCRLRRLHRSNWGSTGSRCSRLGHAAWRTRGHGRRGSYGLAWRRCRCRGSGGTRSDLWLGRLLRDRLQHISGFGDVRQIDLGLELFRLCARAAAAGAAAGLSVLSVILLDALRLIHFDGTGVRLLFRDPNLD